MKTSYYLAIQQMNTKSGKWLLFHKGEVVCAKKRKDGNYFGKPVIGVRKSNFKIPADKLMHIDDVLKKLDR